MVADFKDFKVRVIVRPLLFYSQDCDNLWWDAFTTEFFEDDAMLTITFCLEDGPKRYSKNCFLKVHVLIVM